MTRPVGIRLCVLALLAELVLSGSAGLWHRVETDPLPLPHDAAAHRWGADRPVRSPAGDRCYLCQWRQVVSSPPDGAGRLVVGPSYSGRLRPDHLPLVGLRRPVPLLARSPPAFLPDQHRG